MCLIANIEKTQTIKDLGLDATITVYKAFAARIKTKNIGRLGTYTRLVGFRVTGCYRNEHEYLPGVVEAHGKINTYGKVYEGIHCALDKEVAEAHARASTTGISQVVVIPLQVKLADMIAIGRFSDWGSSAMYPDSEIVVSKLVITQDHLDLIHKAALEKYKAKYPVYFPKRRKRKV